MLKINIRPQLKNLLLIICRDLFLGLFFLLVIFSAMEAVKPRIVTSYINLDLFLLLLLIFGLFTIAYYQPMEKETNKLKFLDQLTIVLFSVVIGIFIIYLTRQIGWLAILVGLAAVIINYYFIILCCQE